MNEIQLYRKNVNSLGQWRIWSECDVIHIGHATVLGGSEVRHTEKVTLNQSGRTISEQVKLRINSRVSRMKDRGYKPSIEEAQASTGNQLGLLRPMLAHPIARVGNVNYAGAVLQKKLDGHRCLITRSDGELIAYSRQGKAITSISHITSALDSRISEGTTVDGELYAHGTPLQTIGSWIKREQPNTCNLYFVAYDLISSDKYTDRHQELSALLGGVDTGAPGRVVVLPFRPYESDEQQASFFKEVRADRFEGLMLRLDNRAYQPGIRSSSLLKIKEWEDAEFEVLDVIPSKDGWGICVCKAPPESQLETFRCSAPGDMGQKRYVLHNREEFKGKMLTVEYAFLTAYHVPFHPNAIRWREDL